MQLAPARAGVGYLRGYQGSGIKQARGRGSMLRCQRGQRGQRAQCGPPAVHCSPPTAPLRC